MVDYKNGILSRTPIFNQVGFFLMEHIRSIQNPHYFETELLDEREETKKGIRGLWRYKECNIGEEYYE